MEKILIKVTDIFPNLKKDWENIYIKDIKIFKGTKKALIVFAAVNKIDKTQIFLEEIKEEFDKRLQNLQVDFEFEILDEEDIINYISSYCIKELDLKDFNYQIQVNDNEINIDFLVEIEKEKLTSLIDNCTLKGYKVHFTIPKKNEETLIYHLKEIKEEEKLLSTKLKYTSEEVSEKVNVKKVEIENKFTYKKIPKYSAPTIDIKDFRPDSGPSKISGIIFNFEFKEILNGEKEILSIYLTDYTESTYIKLFLKKEEALQYKNTLKINMGIDVIGTLEYDNFVNASYIKPAYFEIYEIMPREDVSNDKRIELHLHTNMSALDGINEVEEYFKRAKYWGHEALAITDHSVVQSFPDTFRYAKEYGIKPIFGCELYIVDDNEPIIKNEDLINNTHDNFVVFDVETTGFSSRLNKIIEIGAVKIKGSEIVDSFNILINPEESLSDEIINLTGITDSMLSDKETIDKVLPKFYSFIENSIMVAHNADFDMGFLQSKFKDIGINYVSPYVDTLELSRIEFPNVRSNRLGMVAKRLGVSLENAHRAVDDARATGEVFLKLLSNYLNDNDTFNNYIETLRSYKDRRKAYSGKSYHGIVLAKNEIGLKNLYKIVSDSHLDNFNYTPKVPKSLLDANREGLLVSTACQDGELFQGLLNNLTENRIDEILDYYDYFEVQPTKNNLNLIPDYFKNKEELESFNKQIISLADKKNKLVVATGDVHYIDSSFRESRNILKHSLKINRDEYDNDYSFLTTDEMLSEFAYLGPRAFEIVINNTKKISDQIENIRPIPSGTFPPIIEGSDTMLREITMKKAHEMYGKDIPEYVQSRIDVELDSIIKNGYSVLYIIAQKLVKKSNEDGYQVGSRGSVGSSLVATLCGITEVNPLSPHYLCDSCQYNEFIDTQEIQIFSGHDLPEKTCPKCGNKLTKLGDEIPFEVFLGFDGDKEPDIDLNFAGEYQSTSHKYTEELFGKGKVFRAGTIGTIAEKTAYGFVLKYIEETSKIKSKAEIERLSKTLVGIKRTTGQHAGGIMIVPNYKEIYDFSPIQRPANDSTTGVITTHYDYKSISGTILKLDILGHDVPSMIKMIEEITDTDFMKAPLNDERVLSLFSNADTLEMDKNIYNIDMGTLGVPEFGTSFVQRMLKKTQPKTFAELVQISGLSHGTNVWTGNAEELVNNGKANLKDVISTREDIMIDLINAGADKKFSFYTMEKVRKGKGLNKEEEEIISKLPLPDWYIDSLNKISYMFPKAHAVAYVTMSVRLAYYKVYYPEAFYATYLSTKISNFDLETISKGPEAIKEKLKALKNPEVKLSNKEKLDIPIYEICLEMFARNCKLGKLDLTISDASKFNVKNNEIIPPFTSVPSLGEGVANAIVENRDLGFLSIEDLVNKTKISKACVEYLKNLGTLDGLSESNQLSLFQL